jgi:hypothetical protein
MADKKSESVIESERNNNQRTLSDRFLVREPYKENDMMYGNRLVAAIKVGGQILREDGEFVAVPFGSEYSILIKNLNSVRSQVGVSIDGNDATDGNLIVGANDSIELERFIRNGNLEAGNRFKFIERSKDIEKHRGVKADDGLIRVEYKFERVQPEIIEPIIRPRYMPPYYPPRPRWPFDRRSTLNRIPMRKMMSATRSRSMAPQASAAPRPGITVPGSESRQRFVHVSGFQTENQSHVLILRLLGVIGGKPISRPVTVHQKPVCVNCGKKNKATSKCCVNCGTQLELI